MAIAKKDVQNSSELQRYLQEQAQKSDRLYHFTTLDSLLCIIANKTFRLSRMDLLNDKAEVKLGDHRDDLKYYTMSFSRETEYISMWAMYGRSSGIKLRLDFDRKKLQTAINNNFFYDTSSGREKIEIYSDKTPGHFSKKDFLISDMVYLDKKSKELKHNEQKFISITSSTSLENDMTGFIKYDAWEFERETRLRVQISNHLRDNQVPRYIFAGINDELIKDFHITFNPWMSPEMKQFVKESLNSLVSRIIGTNTTLSYDDSCNDGEVTDLSF